jgi:O-methyltransferase
MSRAVDTAVHTVRRAAGVQSLIDAAEEQKRVLGQLVEQGRQLAEVHTRVRNLDQRLSSVEGGLERDRQKRHEREKAAGHFLARRRPLPFGDEKFWALAEEVRENERTLLGFDRLHVLWQAARNAAPLGLAALEVGSFRGGSAYFLASALREWSGATPELHVVDTFSGHDAADVSESEPHHPAGHFSDTSAEDVARYLSVHEGVRVHAAHFPDGADRLPGDIRLGLVHLDVDLHQPTLASLRWFAPRLTSGAVVVVDDYGAEKCPGVRRALDEFLAEAGADFQVWDLDTQQLVLVRR